MIKKIMLKTIKENFLSYLALLVLIALIVIVGLLPPKILEHLVNDYLMNSNREEKKLIIFASLYLGCIVLTSLFDFAKQVLLIHVGQTFTKDIRVEMAHKLTKVSNLYFSSNDTGVTTSRFTNDVEAINTLFTDGIISMGIDLLKLIGIIIEMFVYSINLGLLTLIIIPLVYFLSTFFKKRMYKAQLENRKIVGEVNNHIAETIDNVKMIKVYNEESYMGSKCDYLLQKDYVATNKVNFFDSIYSPIIQVFTAFTIALVCILTHEKIGLLGISVGALAGAISYIGNLFSPIENLGMELQTIQKARSGVTRIREFLNAEEEEKKKPLTFEEIILERKAISIKCNNLSFGYEVNNEILSSLSFEVKPLEKLSLIGRTGVGKTTLFKLIQGMLSPTKGSITINGIDVRVIPNEIKHLIFGYVNQIFSPIKGSIKENITMKNKNITSEEVQKALEIVGLSDKVNKLAEKENTILNKGIFSQGEEQLLSIARAIVSNPPILLLDEMTSSLDTITEQRVLKAIDNASKERTIISISHRLASCLDAQKIIALEKGKIKFERTKEELLLDPTFSKQLLIEKTWKK